MERRGKFQVRIHFGVGSEDTQIVNGLHEGA